MTNEITENICISMERFQELIKAEDYLRTIITLFKTEKSYILDDFIDSIKKRIIKAFNNHTYLAGNCRGC